METKNVSDPITFKEAQDLPYLQAVIKEGLRVFPATGLPMWRVVPKGGVTICGQYFPENVRSIVVYESPNTMLTRTFLQATVGINAWVAHNNTEVFGSDANKFRPERWLESSSSQIAAMDRYFLSVSRPTLDLTSLSPSLSLSLLHSLAKSSFHTVWNGIEDVSWK